MASFPHTHLFHGPSKTIAISGPHIHVLDSTSGALLHSTTTPDARPVRCAAVDPAGAHLATAGDDKMLRVELPKKPTHIAFARAGQTLVVADKFGDVFSYPLIPAPAPAEPAPTVGGTLVLGHTSLLTALQLSPDGRHVLTADRDEHIRASRFPAGHVVQSFCLGHTRFVSAIHVPRAEPRVLVSGGGDPVLKVWAWRAGALLYDVPVADAVRAFLAVRPVRRARGVAPDGTPKPPGRRGEGAQEAEEEADAEGEEDESADAGDEATPAPAGASEEPGEPPEPVLVVHKIETLRLGARLAVVFSAVGATALFWFALPPDPMAAPDGLVVVHAHDFGRPVVQFALVDGAADQLWVSVDTHWTDEGAAPDVPTHVRLVQLSLNAATEVTPPPALLAALNSTCLIPATESELAALELYEPLTSLPKNMDAAHDPMNRDAEPEASQTGTKRSAKAAAKMRTRMALLEHGAPAAKKVKSSESGEIAGEAMDEA
ncbi:quinon protein alcohol dehydrogenase-like superfamily [Gloeopeniophorella convolvens]|nr:quinon protein alcohol dehydrogenase-like superfamily [Gloeopeniophorella convolvens]